MFLGIDFDNTIVLYDRLLKDIAVREGLVDPSIAANKKTIRDAVRAGPGEDEWIRLQSLLYGVHMLEADPAPGLRRFLETCRERGVPVAVVSHKTRHAHVGPRIELRAVATEWLQVQGFFEGEAPLIARDRVFFEGTREEKLGRIEALGVSHFIDDLVEVFQEATFPATVERILYSTELDPPQDTRIRVMPHWDRIHDHLFPGVRGE